MHNSITQSLVILCFGRFLPFHCLVFKTVSVSTQTVPGFSQPNRRPVDRCVILLPFVELYASLGLPDPDGHLHYCVILSLLSSFEWQSTRCLRTGRVHRFRSDSASITSAIGRCFCAGAATRLPGYPGPVSVFRRATSSAHRGGRASDRPGRRMDPLTRRATPCLEPMSSTSPISCQAPWSKHRTEPITETPPSRNRLTSYPVSARGKAWVDVEKFKFFFFLVSYHTKTL